MRIAASYTGLLNSFVFVSNVVNETNPPPNNTVPEPASLWLFVAGLMAFGVMRRLARAKASSLNF